MKSFSALLLFLFYAVTVSAQTVINTVLLASLPSAIGESSGLETQLDNSIWTHNDSGGQPKLYKIDTTGTLIKTLTVSNASNTDWEDLACDSAGNMFVGDFGNNNNDRQNLVIYRISNPDLITGNSVAAQLIHFSYPDQSAFPPAADARNFDMESMIAMNDSLYLFSKNRTNPYNGYSKLYRVPATAGTYIAQLVDSFYTGPGPLDDYSFTGADINSSHDTLFIISHFRLWIFTQFTGTHFFNGSVQEFIFSGTGTGKEGVCIKNASTIYISDEHSGPGSGNLYKIDFTGILNETPENPVSSVNVFPDPFFSGINITFQKKPARSARYVLTDATGRVCLSGELQEQTSAYYIDAATVACGLYLLEIFSGDERLYSTKLIRN